MTPGIFVGADCTEEWKRCVYTLCDAYHKTSLELPDIEDRLHSETFMQRLVERIEEMNERLSAADHYAYAVEIEKNDMTATPSLQ